MVSGEIGYKIRGWSNIFRTGRSQDGQQLLIGVQLPELVIVVFDRSGTLKSVTSRPLRAPVRGPDEEIVGVELDEAIRELGFIPCGIEVKGFFLSDRWIGIKRLPEHYEEVIKHPERFDDDEAAALRDQIQNWIDRGDFVLYWCEDYYLNRDGEVESS